MRNPSGAYKAARASTSCAFNAAANREWSCSGASARFTLVAPCCCLGWETTGRSRRFDFNGLRLMAERKEPSLRLRSTPQKSKVPARLSADDTPVNYYGCYPGRVRGKVTAREANTSWRHVDGNLHQPISGCESGRVRPDDHIRGGYSGGRDYGGALTSIRVHRPRTQGHGAAGDH